MEESETQSHILDLLVEQIACFTVGIAVEQNTGIGTGTLVEFRGQRFVLTAEHVIGAAQSENIRFWCRPTGSIIKKAASEATAAEIGRLTAGIAFPVSEILRERSTDLALLRLDPSFQLPEPCQYFDFTNEGSSGQWDDQGLDGKSLLYFGFPIANSRLLGTAGNRNLYFIGCAHSFCYYDARLNSEIWSRLESALRPEKDFALQYNAPEGNIDPAGFSGSGVWTAGERSTGGVFSWYVRPIGVIHRYHRKHSLLTATKLPPILDFLERATSAAAAHI